MLRAALEHIEVVEFGWAAEMAAPQTGERERTNMRLFEKFTRILRPESEIRLLHEAIAINL
jgi:hypothetical protein